MRNREDHYEDNEKKNTHASELLNKVAGSTNTAKAALAAEQRIPVHTNVECRRLDVMESEMASYRGHHWCAAGATMGPVHVVCSM